MKTSSIKNPKNNYVAVLVAAAFTLGAATASGAIDIATVTVGYADNAADSTGRGKVDYVYQIGKTEVTNTQYVTFLNAVATTDTEISRSLYPNNAEANSVYYGITRTTLEGEGGSHSYSYALKSGDTDYADKPVVYVSFWDAARFVNWLSTGNTETGVYNLGGVVSPVNSSITRDQTAWENGGFAIANENEWYKAAYYDPTKGDTGGYWAYPIRSDSIGKDDANYDNYSYDGVCTLADVASYTNATSYFGTYDQGGNVWEWIDSASDVNRVIRGGSIGNGGAYLSAATGRFGYGATSEADDLGFRVVSLRLMSVPEPGTWAGAAGLAMLVFGVWVRRGCRTRV
jgi:formylglycine-generating enzyme required for sulfatase activity